MKKKKSRFWFGVVIGGMGGWLAAQSLLEPSRMPNAKTWQRILAEKLGEVGAGIFMARVKQRYKDLKSGRPSFNNVVLDTHMVGNLLPGLALYQTLRENEMTEAEAIEQINRIFETWFDQVPPLNVRVNQLLHYTPENFTIFRRLVRLVMDRLFPAPGWQYEVTEDNAKSFAFNIHHCFYHEVLKHYDATELTPVFCKLDDYVMAAMPPSIRWERTQTIAEGAEFCDFRWDYVPEEKVVVI
jgi:hypothetical protein